MSTGDKMKDTVLFVYVFIITLAALWLWGTISYRLQDERLSARVEQNLRSMQDQVDYLQIDVLQLKGFTLNTQLETDANRFNIDEIDGSKVDIGWMRDKLGEQSEINDGLQNEILLLGITEGIIDKISCCIK
jgi:hypothetical protein